MAVIWSLEYIDGMIDFAIIIRISNIIKTTMEFTNHSAFQGTQKIQHVLYESFYYTNPLQVLVNIFVLRKKVFILEPCISYHVKGGKFKFFPRELPPYIQICIKKKVVSYISAEEIDARSIYPIATEKAVEHVDDVYRVYREERGTIIEYCKKVLKSEFTENIFKNYLCNQIAEFYSQNIFFSRVESFLSPVRAVSVYPAMNMHRYFAIEKLLRKSKKEFFESSYIEAPRIVYGLSLFETVLHSLHTIITLFTQTCMSSLFVYVRKKTAVKKSYRYVMAVTAPRQLRSNRRGFDFLVDSSKITSQEFLYIPIIPLDGSQKEKIEKEFSNIAYPSSPGKLFSHGKEWRGLLFRILFRKNFLFSGNEWRQACSLFFYYFQWVSLLKEVSFHHFITHADFGGSHIGRNIALHQAGVQTWYFMDTMNYGCNAADSSDPKTMKGAHPYWTYLYYDHFVVWSHFLKEYFMHHPNSIKEFHVVGCLWSAHIKKTRANLLIDKAFADILKVKNNHFVVVAFDTTFSRNGLVSYKDGVRFAQDFLRLVKENKDTVLILKEKKARSIHTLLDTVLGKDLQVLYEAMESHPRIIFQSNQADSSFLISQSDMVVSAPFTSPTFEALSINRPAIWHDPCGYYRDTPYAKAGGVTTHSYEELEKKVIEIKNMEPGKWHNPIPEGSPLLDPYRDGRAIDRFRDLLISHTNDIKGTSNSK